MGREVNGVAGKERNLKEGEYDSQPFQCRLNIWEFKENGSIRDLLIVKHEAGPPDSGREADIFSASQIVKNNLGLSLRGHVELETAEGVTGK
jgi:hypothetical protein